MSRQPPTQELVAKDLHGNEWRFRHIFRGNGYKFSFICVIVCGVTTMFMIICHPNLPWEFGWGIFGFSV